MIEVMVAMAILGIAMLALLSLHHQNLQSVIHAQEITRAAMLAEMVMTQAELEHYPEPGTTQGTFDQTFPGLYPGFQWQRSVEESGIFPDVRKVRVVVSYGPRQNQTFGLTEFVHNPETTTNGAPGSNPNQAGTVASKMPTDASASSANSESPNGAAAGNDPSNNPAKRRRSKSR